MKITRVDSWVVRLKLNEPYTIAYETIHYTTNVFLRIWTSSGLVATGCAAPDQEVTGESGESVKKAIAEVIEPLLRSANLNYMGRILHDAKGSLGEEPSALALLDATLHDLLGKAAKLPLWRLLGAYQSRIPTCMTIGIMPPSLAAERAREYAKRGFRYIKLKGGLDVESDVERVSRTRELVGDDVEIGFDANQGFSGETACLFLKRVQPSRLLFIEQPTPRYEPQLLEVVTRESTIDVVADESLITAHSAFVLARQQAVTMFNIKLMKVGGIREAQLIDGLAQTSGIRIMVGCMDEAALANAAGLHYALSSPNVPYVDLDSFFDYSDDPTHGVIEFRDGYLHPSENPGLGWE